MSWNNFSTEVAVMYQRFDKACENNDDKELAYFSQFCKEKDRNKWNSFHRRQICENARNHKYWLACGLTGVVLDKCGWLEWKIPGYEHQEFHPLGCIINRGACNIAEKKALGILQLPNGNWIATVDYDFTSIGYPYTYLGIHDEQYKTKTEAWNNAIKEFVDRWHSSNKDVKKEDEAVKRAKSMIIVDSIAPLPIMKGEPIQLSLF